MNSNPLVSVIMGVYNCADTVDSAIKSIINQTYKNWELIICDDGSQDDTISIVQKYIALYPQKIFLIKNKNNLGLNKTLNKCLAHAKGEYIARMDGDDLCFPNRFEKQVEFLNTHPEFALVSSPMIYFDENGEWGRGTAISEPKIQDFVFHAPCFCHAPVMIRKVAYDTVGGYTEEKAFLRFEDCNLWYKLYAAGFKGANLPEPLYKMRDDRKACKRRTVATRLKAVYVQWMGFRLVNMKWYFYPILIKDLLKGIILSIMPQSLYLYLHHKKKN